MQNKAYRLKDFIDKELKVFSNLDNVRSIPSIIDGLKDAQRKAVFAMLKHGQSEVKVAQLGNYAAKESHYAHGETSMCDTIVGLAQNFPGSNNLNLFEPIGQFGSILSSEASAERYIYTKPSRHLRKLLRVDDDLILKHQYVDGDRVEPERYFPVLPLWLINGCEGIGTGHATKILARDPSGVAKLIAKIVSGVSPHQKTIKECMKPHFKGWTGEVREGESDSQWELHGTIQVVNTTTLKITELPVMYSIDKYKEVLIKLIDEGKVKDFENNSKESGFNITVTVPREIGRKSVDELKAIFKLVRTVTENVTLWDTQGNLRRYESAYEALLDFVGYRSNVYEARKIKLIEDLDSRIAFARAKVEFITYWNTKLVDPHKRSREDLESELSNVVDAKYFDELFSMQIRYLTMEKAKALKEELDKMESYLKEVEGTSPSDFFEAELSDFF